MCWETGFLIPGAESWKPGFCVSADKKRQKRVEKQYKMCSAQSFSLMFYKVTDTKVDAALKRQNKIE